MTERPEHLPEMTPERLNEIEDLLTYESSISFQSGRAHESMWMLVAEVRRLREQRDAARAEVMAELLDARRRAELAEAALAQVGELARWLDREHDHSLVTSDYPLIARRIRRALDGGDAS